MATTQAAAGFVTLDRTTARGLRAGRGRARPRRESG